MTDFENEQAPQNPSRRTFLKGIGLGAVAGAGGALGLKTIFSGRGESGQSDAQNPVAESPEVPPVNPPETPAVQSRKWERYRPDGSLAYVEPLAPEERKDLERDVHNVGRAVETLFDKNTLSSMGVDIDQITNEMKTWDDEKISRWAHRSNTDRGRFEPDLEEVYLQLGETGIYAWYVVNVQTGEFGAIRVSVTVDGDGKYLKDTEDTSRPLTTQEGLLALPSNLLPLVKAPDGASPAYSHNKLNFTSHVGASTDGNLEAYDLNSDTYATSDGQLFQLSCSRRGKVYDVSVLKHENDVNLTIRGKGGEVKLP